MHFVTIQGIPREVISTWDTNYLAYRHVIAAQSQLDGNTYVFAWLDESNALSQERYETCVGAFGRGVQAQFCETFYYCWGGRSHG